MFELKTFGLFVVTAVAEIAGCYLPYLWLKKDGPAWLLVPAAGSLALFFWLWAVDGVRPTLWDGVGAAVAIAGMAIILFAPRHG
jgi:small multidrug resistance family-3 protein